MNIRSSSKLSLEYSVSQKTTFSVLNCVRPTEGHIWELENGRDNMVVGPHGLYFLLDFFLLVIVQLTAS